jgi:hypothetical protein
MDTMELNAGTHLPVPQVGATREATAVQVASAAPAADTSLDQIRDILFGAVVRDTDKKLARLEERLLKEQDELKEDARRRFEPPNCSSSKRWNHWMSASRLNTTHEMKR